jgi:hypothetical protein
VKTFFKIPKIKRFQKSSKAHYKAQKSFNIFFTFDASLKSCTTNRIRFLKKYKTSPRTIANKAKTTEAIIKPIADSLSLGSFEDFAAKYKTSMTTDPTDIKTTSPM